MAAGASEQDCKISVTYIAFFAALKNLFMRFYLFGYQFCDFKRLKFVHIRRFTVIYDLHTDTRCSAFWICSAGIALLLSLPHVGGMEALWKNGIYDSVCVILLFPMLVYLGASGHATDKGTARICKFVGDISYPVYVVHYPFMYLFYAWVWDNGLTFAQAWPVAIGIIVGSVLLAYACLKWYDEPLRRYLTARTSRPK